MGRAEDLFHRIEVGGGSIIDEYINTRRSEELFIDFKRSSDNGSKTCLSENDRNNLAKAISGFGNSEGGILIWGIDCSKEKDGTDVAKYKNPIINPARFVSWLENAVSGCTVPPHPRVRNISICLDGEDKGFVITYIPKSHHAPHQVVGKLQYYIRAGSNFVPVPHMVLPGMFGRPYPSHVFAMYLVAPATVEGRFISSEIGILIRNDGPGIVQDLYGASGFSVGTPHILWCGVHSASGRGLRSRPPQWK